ncbi:hypothetical protein Dshi_2652 [Dinoroseobacter shibae DFL 12 = DSM 16493]|jgi:hypothetical protein|uniref:Hedgehog/Intein (Hint) domain-containing protein n=1 Tax=Dinoroseobacter shibae (strain DSM 16493 / NCIMB 14021 / DFL 12) TaxID=398580 RepID=A8LI51_DINSH|nr:Hint domain-containing protein [Dinoroseobacter shibae]ABV94385.1 hypothetical protein Dshi_2652 [Dinoroseobacter shibae DFL 12 = DSM 16493]URF45814.1 Hint domain-containing protein [Dinoroseobacter shibae]URF50120.1 Hint domain-containing protein [Dinoroseobacter shibae]
MAPLVRPPVPVTVSNGADATAQPSVLARFDSHCIEQGARSFCARKPEIVTRLLPAFGILAQGTQIRVPTGSVAIEDLGLGDTIAPGDGGTAQITWIGEVTLRPDALDTPWLRRVQPERFGFGRPLSDSILGAAAEVQLGGARDISKPLSTFGHDDMITALVPQAPVRMFQIACASPAWAVANGLSIRTLNTDGFLSRQPDLLAQMFARFMPGLTTRPAPERFVTASPFRRARLG